MYKYFFLLLVFFSIKNSFSLNEYQIKSNNCYGNNEIDKLDEIYQLNDSTYATVLKFYNNFGYFATSTNNSTWIVKLDKNYNIINKTKIIDDASLNSDFKFDPITKSVCFINVGGNVNNIIQSIKVYQLEDASLKLNITINDTFIINNSAFQSLNVNESGGYLLRYYIQHPTSIDSIRIIAVDSNLHVWCNKTLSTNYFDTIYTLIDSINLNLIDKHHWLSSVYFDNNNLYAESLVHDDRYPVTEGKTAILLHKFNKNLYPIYTKLIDYSDSIGDFQIDYLQSAEFFKSNDKLIFNQGLNEFSSAMYLMDTSLNVIKKVIPNANQNRRQRNASKLIVRNNKIYMKISLANAPLGSYSNYLVCYDNELNILHVESIDSSFGGYFSGTTGIVNYYSLLDSGFILVIAGSYNGMSNRHYMKVNQYAQKIWICPMNDNYIWKTKKIKSANSFTYYVAVNGAPFFAEPVIENIAGKQRAFVDYREFLDESFGVNKDTTVIVEFKINLDNGKIIDTNIIASITTPNNSVATYFNYLRKNKENEYALLGTSNQLCSGRKIDIFSAKSSLNFNTLYTKVFLDLNSNSILDNNEHYLDNVSNNITKNNTTTESYFNENGYIINYVDTGKFDINVLNTFNYFNSIPSSVTKNYTTFGNKDTFKFALQPIAIVNDLMIQLNINGRGRPGFNGSYILNVSNNGTTIQNAIAKLKLSENIDSISTFPSAIISNDTLSWIFNNVEPNEQPVNNIGDTLFSTATISPILNDTFPSDNVSILNDVMSGSFDPNDKIVDKNEYSSSDFDNKEYIKYTIRFENTGNDTAFQVVIVDTLDANLDISTFKPLNGLYTYATKITNGNVLTFTFNPILLAPKHTTAVSYLIKPKNSISNGISIKNKASIKFDYNEPIITNNTQTRISIITGLQNKKTTTNFELHPNPANNEIYIEFINTDIVNYLQIFDIQGNVLNKLDLKSNKSINIDVRNYPNGVYFINFIDKNNQSSSVKFVITR